MFSKTRQNLSATIRNFKCEEQDKAKSFNEYNNIAQILLELRLKSMRTVQLGLILPN